MPSVTERKEATVTSLFSKRPNGLPGKEGLMIIVEHPPGSSDPVHRHQTFYEGPSDVRVVGRNAS